MTELTVLSVLTLIESRVASVRNVSPKRGPDNWMFWVLPGTRLSAGACASATTGAARARAKVTARHVGAEMRGVRMVPPGAVDCRSRSGSARCDGDEARPRRTSIRYVR